MSRSVKGHKGPGYEYWGKRGYPAVRMASPGKFSKRRTHKVERQQRKKLVKEPA